MTELELVEKFNHDFPVNSTLMVKIGRREPEAVRVRQPAYVESDLMQGSERAVFLCGIGHNFRYQRTVWVQSAYFEQ